MSLKIIIPWHIRMPEEKSKSPGNRNGWNRKHFCGDSLSEPLRSVRMEEDDLDHLGALHQAVARSSKAQGVFRRLFRHSE